MFKLLFSSGVFVLFYRFPPLVSFTPSMSLLTIPLVVQITVKTSRTLFSLLQLEVSLEHRLVVGGELFHGGGGTLGLFGWGCASGTLEPSAYTYTRAAQPPPAPTSILSGCFPETTEVTSKVQAKQNRFPFFIFLSGNSQFP